LARTWSPQDPPSYVDSARTCVFPPAVFPIFGLLLHIRIFDPDTVDSATYDEARAVFFEDYEEAPFSAVDTVEERLLTTLILTLLVINLRDFDKTRIADFVEGFSLALTEVTNLVLVPLLAHFEVIANRYATAKFETEALLEDFSQVVDAVVGEFDYPQPVCRFLIERLTALIDVKLLNKVIATPARFMFQNAVVWNSFITSLEAVEQLQFPLMRQSACILVMAKGLTTQGNAKMMYDNICKDIDPKLVFYLLKNSRPDQMMPDVIDPRPFGDAFEIKDVLSIQPVKPSRLQGFESLAAQINLDGWNKGKCPDAMLSLFPFFEELSAA
jgi:hypothetical protein